MTNAPDMNESPSYQPSQPALDTRVVSEHGFIVPESIPAPSAPSRPPDESLADQSGRILGPRALKTRARILDATLELLDEKSMRDLRVIDIARRIGSSPATFYQYFKDVEDVVLELATQIHDMSPAMAEVIRGDWSGREGHERGRQLANLFIDHYERYASILRVRNNAAEEGSQEFSEVRLKTMMPIVKALGEAITRAHPVPATRDSETWSGGNVHPITGAMMIMGNLEAMAVHHAKFVNRFEVSGEGREQMVETVASVIQMMLAPDGR